MNNARVVRILFLLTSKAWGWIRHGSILSSVPVGDELTEQSKPPKEKEADAFASELLVPYYKLKKYQADINNIDKLAGIFQVSKQAMAVAVMNYWKYSRKAKR